MSHERVFELLPWLVNGSLDERERELVEQHVRTCLPCHREVKVQQRLRAAMRSHPAIHLSAQNGFAKLTSALGAPGVRVKPRRRLATLTRFAVVGAAGVALLGTLLWLTTGTSDRFAPVYDTLATPPARTEAAIDVVFTQATTAADMQALLGEIDGSIAAGPSALGRYTIRLNDARGSVDLDAVLARLQRDSRVRYAGPALAAQEAE